MAKADYHPFWPGWKCEAEDEELASSLHSVGRGLVSLLDEKGGIRAVRFEEIRPFDGTIIEDEDLEEASKNVRSQLDEVRLPCPCGSPVPILIMISLFFLLISVHVVYDHGSTNRSWTEEK